MHLPRPLHSGIPAAILLVAWLTMPTVAQPPTRYVEGDVLVTFRDSASLENARATLSRHSLAFARHYDTLSQQRHRHTGLVRENRRTTAALIAELQADPAVESAEPNYLRWTSSTPNDSRFGELWGLQNTGQSVNGTTGTPGADIKYLPAWTMAKPNAATVVVGVIDTGVDYTHPDLAANIWTNPGETAANQIDDDHNGYIDDIRGYDFIDYSNDPYDSGDHGTHVAGTIAACGNNRIGVIGINPQARIMPLKVSNDGSSMSTSAIISALQYATTMKGKGVNIVALNASYGGGGYTAAESSAIQAAGTAGIIFCAAAGNNSTNNDVITTYPAGYRLSNMIVVAATGQNDNLASFSNYGPTSVDIAAPGVNILSTKPANNGTATLQIGTTTYNVSPLTYSNSTTGITDTVYYCGFGNPSDFPAAVKGHIALIQRGTLTFADKTANAKAAGARASIIFNNVSGTFNGTLSTPGAWLPTVSLSQTDGLAIQATLPVTATLTVTPDYQYLDGTSMATPHVTGAVAFAAMNFPNDTVAQRIQRVLNNSDTKSSLQGKVVNARRLNLLRTVDTDANGLPDWWEQSYFGQATGTNPTADPDHDGMTNLQEFLAGTNPTSSQSSLRVSSIVRQSATGSYTITWSAVPGKTYQVKRSSTLSTWLSDLPNSQLTAQTGQTSLSYTDNTTTGVAKRFYRVEVVP